MAAMRGVDITDIRKARRDHMTVGGMWIVNELKVEFGDQLQTSYSDASTSSAVLWLVLTGDKLLSPCTVPRRRRHFVANVDETLHITTTPYIVTLVTSLTSERHTSSYEINF